MLCLLLGWLLLYPSLCFIKLDVSAVEDYPSFGIVESVSFHFISIANKNTLLCFGIQLLSLILRDVSIGITSEDTQMINVWLLPRP